VRAEDCGHKMGLNGVDNGRLWFENVRVPRTALLDRFGHVSERGEYSSPIPSEGKRFFTMLGTLVGGRINAAGGALAASKAGLAIALRYGSLRRQFPDEHGTEQAIGDYLTHRLRLLPALANAYAFSFAQQALIERVERAKEDPEAGREIGTLAAGLKAIGTWRAIATLQNCRECCGGQGYLTSNRIDVLRTDADVFATFEGDNSVLCQLVAKDLLREYARAFEDSPLRGLVRTLAADVSASLSEKNPLATRRTGAEDLLDPAFHAQALRYRERSLVGSLGRRIQRRREEGLSAQAALEACQDHALSLARAHIERFALESFQRATERDPSLGELCGLYALSVIEADLGWFVEQEYVAPNKARAIRKQVRELLGSVAAVALPLVEAFGIPTACLGPLADPSFLVASGLVRS
jgi:acyl-CoA oxidase